MKRRMIMCNMINLLLALVLFCGLFFSFHFVSLAADYKTYSIRGTSSTYAYNDITIMNSGEVVSGTNFYDFEIGDHQLFVECNIVVPLYEWNDKNGYIYAQSDIVNVSSEIPIYPTVSWINNDSSFRGTVDITAVYFCFDDQQVAINDTNWFNMSFDTSLSKGRVIQDSFYFKVKFVVSSYSLSLNESATVRVMCTLPQGYALNFTFFDNVDTVNLEKQTEELTNGFDSSAGSSANQQISSDLNSYVDTEGSLFASSKSELDSFEFTDFTAVSSITAAFGFINSVIMMIYNSFGGAGGIGILVSVSFCVLFASILVGIHRYYKSKDGG